MKSNPVSIFVGKALRMVRCLPFQSHTKPHTAPVAGVIFSKDRPLQLDATLASWKRHVRDADCASLTVLYTTSSQWSETLYRHLQRAHADVAFIRERRFRRDLLRVLRSSQYVLFLVDDCLFVRAISIASAVASLENMPQAIGVSFRLGRNTHFCYVADAEQQVPTMYPTEVGTGDCRWLSYRWPECEHDFAYPLEVSSSLYRSTDVMPILRAIRFRNPNQLESRLSRHAESFVAIRPLLLAAETSMAFCNPCNRVQHDYLNRAGSSSEASSQALMEAYARGERVRVADLDGYTPSGCHEEVNLPLCLSGAPVLTTEDAATDRTSFVPLLKSLRRVLPKWLPRT